MVRQGTLIVVATFVVFLGTIDGFSQVSAPSKTADAGKPSPPPSSIADRPYVIRALLFLDPGTGLGDPARSRLISNWLGLVRRFVGPVWDVEVVGSNGALGGADTDEGSAEVLKPHSENADKIWMFRARRSGGLIRFEGREFDVALGVFGSSHVQESRSAADLPRTLLRLSLQVFAPSAVIVEQKGGGAMLRVRGGAIPSKSEIGRIVAPGTVFRAYRVFLEADESVRETQRIGFTYLRAESSEQALTRCGIVSALRDPLTNRIAKKHRLVALGIKPSTATPTKLRFIQRGDKKPAPGYVLTARAVPDGPAREIATTDREGKAVLPRGYSDGLSILRLVAGRAEPMVELPIMPGETDEEIVIPFDPKPGAVALESELDALRDEIVDLVAVRGRLEKRLKARTDGEDWPGVEETLKEYRNLPPRDRFVKRLQTLKSNAETREAASKTLILTKTARTQLTDTQSLIDRYLDDEIFLAYEDAANRSREEAAKKKSAPQIRPSAAPSALVAQPAAEPGPTAPPDRPPNPEPAAKPTRAPAKAPEGVVPF